VAPDGSRGVAVLHCSRWDGGWDKLADQYRGSNTLVLAVVDKPKYPELRWDLTLLQYPRPELTQAVAGIISNLAKEHLRLEKESGVTVNASLMRSFISEHEGHFQVPKGRMPAFCDAVAKILAQLITRRAEPGDDTFSSLTEKLQTLGAEMDAKREETEAESFFWAMRGAYWHPVAEWCYADKQLPVQPPDGRHRHGATPDPDLDDSQARGADIPRHAWVVPRLMGQARIIIGINDALEVIDNSWDYGTVADALEAFELYDGSGEPDGWVRHMATGRRRPEGDATKEEVRW